MPVKLKDYGFRTSILIPSDIEKLLQRGRVEYRKQHGYMPSRSAMIIMAVRKFFRPHQGDQPENE